MNAGKKGRQAIFIIGPVSFLPRYNASFFGRRDIPDGFFPRAGKATAKRNNIKEDVQ
jgi:hypothetical protein